MELVIQEDFGTNQIKFWLKDDDGYKRIMYGYDGEFVTETIREPTTVDIAKPFLSVPWNFADKFIKAVAEYADKTGVKTEKRDFIEGELIATKRHLEDLQKAFNTLLDKNSHGN